MDKIKAVIFDMDGVLLDTESICKKCWIQASEELGLAGGDIIFKRCIGCNNQDILKMVQDFFCDQKEDFDANSFYNRTSELFKIEEVTNGLPKMKGVDDCLKKLKSKGYILAVASSTRRVAVTRQLTAAGIIDYFNTLTCGDSVVHSKPDPEIYLKACKSIGVLPENCVAIEDSANGIKSAYSAGLRCVMVPDQIEPTEDLLKLVWRVIPSLEVLNDYI